MKKLDLNNTVIELLNDEHGQKVKAFFERQGINVAYYSFSATKMSGLNPFIFYGIQWGVFKNYPRPLPGSGIRIATLEELEAEENYEGLRYVANKHFWNNGWAKQGSNIASHFFGNNEQNCLPTIEQYKRLQTTGYFQKEYSELEAMYLQDRFVFNLPYATTDVWNFTPDKVRYGHPTQKPQDICQRIIKASSNENDNVLIPFAGSGSEIVACEELKRNWTAFEIEDSYIEIINKRLDEFKTKLF